jgi:DNA polymerase-3 subunit epsilon
LQRCDGACVGEESFEVHDRRLRDALAPLAIPQWPVAGAAVIRECAPDGGRVDVHVVRDWCWLGTARDDGELTELAAAPQRAEFDLDVTRLLLRRHRAGALALVPFTHHGYGEDASNRRQRVEDACAASTSATHAVSRFA